MNMKRKLAALPAGMLSVLIASIAGPVQAADTFAEMFTQGKAGVSFRYRFEHVDQDNFDKKAKASTTPAALPREVDPPRPGARKTASNRSLSSSSCTS